MMRKNAILLCLSFIIAINGYAKQRTETEALTVAQSFYNKTSNLRNSVGELALAYVATDGAAATRSASDKAYYYIYNKGDIFRAK